MWLDEAYLEVRGFRFEAAQYAAKLFSKTYSSIRLYHATRSEHPEFFRTNGIPISDFGYLEKRAYKFFDDEKGVRAAIQEIADSGYSTHNCGKIWTCLDSVEIQGNAGHYLKSGPEYIQNIGRILGRKHELQDFGIPTLIGFDIKIADLAEKVLHSVVRAAVEAIFHNWNRSRRRRLDSPQSLCVLLEAPVSPSKIREIIHPHT